MPKCPNCGQITERTEDWACKWCGYPLISKSYKKLPKTYKQLQIEKLPEQEPPVQEEAEVSILPSPSLPPPRTEPAPKPEPEPVTEPELEPVPELELEGEPTPKPELEPEPEFELEGEPTPKPELEPVAQPIPEPIPATIEVTVAELLSAYETNAAAAEAKFSNKILKVTGIVDRVEVKDTLDVCYITLSTAETRLLQDIRCTFHRKHGPELILLSKGQTVTVQGKFDGSIIDICLRDCTLVH